MNRVDAKIVEGIEMNGNTGCLGAYAIGGRATDPRLGITHAIEAERIGLGSIWASERWETKETGALCGAIVQATSRIRVVAGLMHFTGRHPLVSAGMASTLQFLSGNRFAMGVGRSVPQNLKERGFPVFNIAHMREYVQILRQLWAGDAVSYDGILGTFPRIELTQVPEVPPPLILGAIGPKTLALGGEAFDGVVLHPFLTPEGVGRSCAIIRDAAAAAGRDPTSVKITAVVVTAVDTLAPSERASAVDARAISYFAYRELARPIIEVNGWDPSGADQLVESGLSKLEHQKGNAEDARRQLAAAIAMLPSGWLESAAALGSVEQCAARIREYRNAGADEVLIHGMTPDRLEPIVQAYRRLG